MDLFIAYQLEQRIRDHQKKNTIPLNPLKVDTTYKPKSCTRCGQNPYFCQCFNINGVTPTYNSSYHRTTT